MAGEWIGQLEADLQGNEAFTQYATISDFAKSHLEAKGKLTESEGRVKALEGEVTTLKGTTIPRLPDNPTPEQKDAFYKSLGKPEKADEYEFVAPADGQMDEKLVAAARQAFHTNNLSKEQAKGMSAWWNEFVASEVKAIGEQREKERNEAETKLKAELGDKYDAAVELVHRVWKKYTNAEFDAFVNETKIGNDPRLIGFMVNLAKLTGEDTSPLGATDKGAKPREGVFNYDKTPPVPGRT